jgi:hypothetical protein
MDRGDIKTANALDLRSVEIADQCDPASRDMIRAASAAHDLAFRNDPGTAGEKVKGILCNSLTFPWDRHRTNAVRSLLNGDSPRAVAEIDSAESLLPKHLPCYDFERIVLSRLRAKATTAIV